MTSALFQDCRFGLFIHWGIYALKGWHEQLQWRAAIPKADYTALARSFNPTAFDPDRWLDLAEEAGMTYLCFTAKHHDGFCMWDTQTTDYAVTRTPYGKDPLALLADACRRRNIRLSLYYSCPDWHCPYALNFGGDHQLPAPNPGDTPDLLRYVDYVAAQIRELCTRYGDIAQFFWDIPPNLRIPRLNALLRELQPGILINNRGFGPGDYDTPERHVPAGREFRTLTEACQSVGAQSWGYRENEDYFTPPFLIRSMARIFAMGGNYLLNVGPRPDGVIPPPAADIVRRVGHWFQTVRTAIDHTRPASRLTDAPDVFLTRKNDTLFAFLVNGCNASGFSLEPIAVQPLRATLLQTGRPLRAAVELLPAFWNRGPCLHISDLPVHDLAETVPVIRLDFPPGTLDRLENARKAWNPVL